MVGAAWFLVTLGAVAVTAVRLRAALLPLSGSVARAAEVVLGWSVLIVLSEVLGTVGLLSRVALAGSALAAAALAVGWRARPRQWPSGVPAAAGATRPASQISRGGEDGAVGDTVPGRGGRRPTILFCRIAAGAAAGAVLAQAVASTAAVWRTGVLFVDALNYHLPVAAHMATTHSTAALLHIGPVDAPAWYPFNAELLQAVGMVLTGHDATVLVWGLADTAAALLAGWCVAQVWGAGPVGVLAVSVLLARLGLGYAGNGGNDWAATWPLLAALAFGLRGVRAVGPERDGLVLLAGLALGLAAGSKLSLLAPVAVAWVGLVAAARGARLRTAVMLGGFALLSGGYWYARDLLIAGTPLPNLRLPGLPAPGAVSGAAAVPVVRYLLDAHVLRHYYLPGLRTFLGPGYLVLLAAVGAATVLALLARGPRGGDGAALRLTGWVTAASAAAWLLVPSGAAGPPGQPVAFPYQIRYALPAFALGLMLVGIRARPGRLRTAAAVGLGALLVSGLGPHANWARGWPVLPVLGAALGIAVCETAHRTRGQWRVGRTVRGATALLGAILALIGLATVQSGFRDRRYRPGSAPALFAFARGLHDSRVGLLGLPTGYPFLGDPFSNRVSYLGRVTAANTVVDYPTCPSLLRAAEHDGDVWVVVRPFSGAALPVAAGWLDRATGVQRVLSTRDGEVFRLSPASRCSAPDAAPPVG